MSLSLHRVISVTLGTAIVIVFHFERVLISKPQHSESDLR